MEAGARPSQADRKGESALSHIAASGSIEALAIALTHLPDPREAALLHHALLGEALRSAARAGRLDTVTFMLESGADVNAHSRSGHTPLGEALAEGHGPCAEVLLDTGADPNAPSGKFTPLAHAARAGLRPLIVRLIAAGADLRPPAGAAQRSALHCAVRAAQQACLQALLDAGADPNGCPKAPWTPLAEAAQVGRRPLMHILLDAGADPNRLGTAGLRPLGQAAAAGRPGCVALLLARGADPNAPNAYHETSLHAAARRSHPEIAQLLIGAGADPGATTDDATTALHLAASGGHPEVVRVLLEAGAPVDARDASGATPLHSLCSVPLESPPFGPHNARSACARHLLGAGSAALTLHTAEGRTPLHLAARSALAPLLSTFIEAGADIHAPNAEGETALHLLLRSPALTVAREGKVLEALRPLLLAGADPHRPDANGRSALALAHELHGPRVIARLCAQARAQVLHPQSTSARGADPGPQGPAL